MRGSTRFRGEGGDGLPPSLFPLRDFLEAYAAGAYWESHEILEEPWRRTGSDFYQGLILLASAYVHAHRGNPHGIRAQAAKALERLAGVPSPWLGIDVERVRRVARWLPGWVAALEQEAPSDDDAPAWWGARIPHLHLVADPGRIRGDEPELDGGPPGVRRSRPSRSGRDSPERPR